MDFYTSFLAWWCFFSFDIWCRCTKCHVI